jgi:hypothetical protein
VISANPENLTFEQRPVGQTHYLVGWTENHIIILGVGQIQKSEYEANSKILIKVFYRYG